MTTNIHLSRMLSVQLARLVHGHHVRDSSTAKDWRAPFAAIREAGFQKLKDSGKFSLSEKGLKSIMKVYFPALSYCTGNRDILDPKEQSDRNDELLPTRGGGGETFLTPTGHDQ